MTAFNNEGSNDEPNEENSLDLSGELNVKTYIHDIAASQKTVKEVAEWHKAQLGQQQETTRSSLASHLTMIFGGTLAATYIFLGVSVVNPSADKALVKDITSMAITSQVALLGTAIGYYFGAKES
jgi:hypothetical protein